MQCNYVAFGQLIDGEKVLKTIETSRHWYQSPTDNIIIYSTGILNLDCPDIWINPHAQQYIDKHIENLFALGDLFLTVSDSSTIFGVFMYRPMSIKNV